MKMFNKILSGLNKGEVITESTPIIEVVDEPITEVKEPVNTNPNANISEDLLIYYMQRTQELEQTISKMKAEYDEAMALLIDSDDKNAELKKNNQKLSAENKKLSKKIESFNKQIVELKAVEKVWQTSFSKLSISNSESLSVPF